MSSGFQNQEWVLPYSHCGVADNVHSLRSTSGAARLNHTFTLFQPPFVDHPTISCPDRPCKWIPNNTFSCPYAGCNEVGTGQGWGWMERVEGGWRERGGGSPTTHSHVLTLGVMRWVQGGVGVDGEGGGRVEGERGWIPNNTFSCPYAGCNEVGTGRGGGWGWRERGGLGGRGQTV